MTSVLLDNATLTAVQRITGQVSSRSRDSVDVDLVAFENYVQARLFFEDVLAIDDYVPDLRESRRAAFPVVRFLESTSWGIDRARAAAAAEASSIHPRVRGGNFDNPEFKSLFELLGSHMICTWDVSSSIYHLTLKVLAEDGSENFQKYGAVATAIFGELADAAQSGARVQKAPELIDRYGNPIGRGYQVPGAKWGGGTTGELTTALSSFVAALVWLAERSTFYSLAAAHLKVDSYIYPIRQTYQQKFLASSLKYGDDFPRRIVSTLSRVLSTDATDIACVSGSSVSVRDLPIFSAWLTVESGDPRAVLRAVEELRQREEFCEARSLVGELRQHFDDGDLERGNKKLRKAAEDIEKQSRAMRERYSVKTRQGVPLTRLVSIYNAAASVLQLPQFPGVSSDIAVPSFLPSFGKRGGFSAIYRNAMDDLATFASMGKARDALARCVVLSDEPAWRPKAEAPRYRNSHSSFKSPM